MRRISIFSILAIIFFGACAPEEKPAGLHPCGTETRDAFKDLKAQVDAIGNPDALVVLYEKHLDSLILNWDFLVKAEDFQIESIEKTLNQVATHENCNIEKVNEIKGYLCLVESNRLPADEINDSLRIRMFDNLLDTLRTECVYQVLDLANIPHDVENEEEQFIDPDSLLTLINDSIITENIYAVENQDNIIFVNSTLYIESAAQYNQFIEDNRVELEARGLKNLKQFPGFYE